MENQKKWIDGVLPVVFEAIVAAPKLREALIFKGARILNVHLGTNRQSLDIDSNIAPSLQSAFPDIESQAAFLKQHLPLALRRHFEQQNPVRFSLVDVQVSKKPATGHPRGWTMLEVRVRLQDNRHPKDRSLPAVVMEVAAPELLGPTAVQTITLFGFPAQVYSLERIAGEKLRAYLTSLPAYRKKMGGGLRKFRVKDLHDIARISTSPPRHPRTTFVKKSSLIQWTFLGLLALSSAKGTDTAIPINANEKGRTFDGIGALSAGASSRLLIDYPEPQRSEILDYLFKPNFGAALQINKVEIGGDMNSTDGSEPSHMRTREDENYQRGYEWWLMEESKKRNPAVKLWGLEWGAPNWVNPEKNDVWTRDNITFILNWVRGAKTHHNLSIDYLGGWNEKGFNEEWYKQFREALNQAGLTHIKVVADDSFKWKIGPGMVKDPQFAASFEIVGMHYPGAVPKETSDWQACFDSGKPLWGSEIGSQHYDKGAGNLAKLYNQGYIGSKMTSYINWSTIWSVLPGLPYSGDGLMLSNTPWSGYYEVGKSIWATAHTTQFAQPGWRYQDRACGYFGGDAKKGSYVTLSSPNHKDYSLIAETVDAKEPQSATYTVSSGFSTAALHVWRTDLRSNKTEDWFIQQPDVTPKNGSFTMTFDPGCVYSLTTTTGQAKGITTPPSAAMLALPYREDFQQYDIGQAPKYFSDQHGTFEVAAAGGGRKGKCLRQTVTAKPIFWNCDADPATLVGDAQWRNYRVSSDVLLEQPGYVALIGRMMGTHKQNVMTGYHLRLTDKGHWSLLVISALDRKAPTMEKELASGDLAAAPGTGTWHKLSLEFSGSRITAKIDDVVVASSVNDTTFSKGLVGYQANRWQTAQFMNFEVSQVGRDSSAKMTDNLAKIRATVIACDSQAPNYAGAQAIDGNPDTFWHTSWKPKPAPFPHFLTIDLGKSHTLKGITCLPRQDIATGRAADCEVYLSETDSHWADPIATVTANDFRDPTEIRFKDRATGRYLKIVVKSSHNQNPTTAIAELGILE